MIQRADNPESGGTKLRTLDALEEYFWLSENTVPRTTMILAEVAGSTTVEAWREALSKVQRRYPLLSARVRKNPGQRPYFETAPDTQLPLRSMPLEGASLDGLIAQEPVASFGYGDGPLARLTLCHSPERCAILLAAHHRACDGRTNVRIVQDLIAAVSGEALGDGLPLLPAAAEFFGLGEHGPYVALSAAKAPSSNFRHSLPAPQVRRYLLDAKDMQALRAAARDEGTTVQGALIAAFFLAGRRFSGRWRTVPTVCLSPVDLRPMLDLSGAAGLLISVHPSVMQPGEDLPFWDFARQLKQGMRASQTKEVAAIVLNGVREVMQREGDPDDPSTVDPSGAYNHDLMVSNYGDTGVRTEFGHLTLKSLYPSVITGNVDTQTISVLTFNGALHFTHISRQPFPSLMEDACALIQEACRLLPATRP